MKKILLGTAFMAGALMLTHQSQAQVRVGINVNIGDQPSWRDTRYDYVEYYYLPDIETYYYVPGRQFIYLSGGQWLRSSNLPPRYRSYNLNTGYKVVVNRPNAYQYYQQDRVRYHGNNSWKNNRHDNGRHNGQWKRHGRH